MGNGEEDDTPIYTQEEMAMLGNTDMSNMQIVDDAARLTNQHPDLQPPTLGSMPNLPILRHTPLGLIANKKESFMLLGIGALLGVGIKAVWDSRTR
jgi:hypothetical protein